MFDKFAHIAGLRPVKAARRATAELPNESDRLGELLGAVAQRNRYGKHLVARRWYAEPEACAAKADALRLLAPDAPAAAADPEQWLFLDTETTGLAGGTGTYAFLVGVAWWDAGGLQIEQFFMRDHSEEHSLLLALAERLAERRVLVTFNGKSFDWPLLETRYRMTRQIKVPGLHAHLDLLHPARQLWRLRLESSRLSEIERHILAADARLAWNRDDDIPGHLIPAIYFDYLRGGAAEPVAAVFRHNQMDLRGLAALAGKIFALVEQCESVEGDALELYGLSRLLNRRGERERARRLYERALDAGLPGAVSRAARRELALLAKRERDYPRAVELWNELTGDVGVQHAPSGDPRVAPTSNDGSDGTGAPACAPPLQGQTHRSAPTKANVGGALEAYEQLAIYYEHHARPPRRERAAELMRNALRELRRALRTGEIDPRRHQRMKARLDHRLTRLTRKAGAAQTKFEVR